MLIPTNGKIVSRSEFHEMQKEVTRLKEEMRAYHAQLDKQLHQFYWAKTCR
ncbi:hypothetical protein GCM10025884_06720 [Leuconostoc gelidum subsp. gelidum]|nr:hypothetical protein GCM10025884_06720 [Leuconostoc gelidum subsp. gelidum]